MRLRVFVAVLSLVVATFFCVAVATGHQFVAISVLAGALTGLFETLILYPVENLKTQQQLHHGSLRDVFIRTKTRYGLRGFYFGIIPVIAGAIPTQALRWGTFTAYCGLPSTDCQNLLLHIILAAALSAVVVSLIIGVPIETLKTEQIHRSAVVPFSHSPVAIPVHSWQHAEEEQRHSSSLCLPRNLFKGFTPTILKKILNQAIRFPVHHVVLAYLCAVTSVATADCDPKSHVMLSCVAGAMAGVSSIFVTQPVDLAKTRMQGLSSHRYRHMVHCWSLILREESWLVLCDGMMARILRSSLGSALTFTLVPLLQAHLMKVLGNEGTHH